MRSKRIKWVIGAPTWDRAWSLPLWLESVRANVSPKEVGLVFVVPSSDHATRDMITAATGDFAWVEVVRDKAVPFDRDKIGTVYHHKAMAAAKNYILSVAIRVRPDYLLMWDTDLLLPEGSIETIQQADMPLMGVWAWLNRQKPNRLRHMNPETQELRYVLWERPMQATAMKWTDTCRAAHYPSADWDECANGVWRADVVLGFQSIRWDVYTRHTFREHVDGEDVPFHWSLEKAEIPRYINGDIVGVHLYKPDAQELKLSWPEVMTLAKHRPLGASGIERDPIDELLGFYPEGNFEHA